MNVYHNTNNRIEYGSDSISCSWIHLDAFIIKSFLYVFRRSSLNQVVSCIQDLQQLPSNSRRENPFGHQLQEWMTSGPTDANLYFMWWTQTRFNVKKNILVNK